MMIILHECSAKHSSPSTLQSGYGRSESNTVVIIFTVIIGPARTAVRFWYSSGPETDRNNITADVIVTNGDQMGFRFTFFVVKIIETRHALAIVKHKPLVTVEQTV